MQIKLEPHERVNIFQVRFFTQSVLNIFLHKKAEYYLLTYCLWTLTSLVAMILHLGVANLHLHAGK